MGKVPNKKNHVERQFAKQLQEAGIKGFQQNVRFIPGRRFEADFFFPEIKVCVEIDGGLFLPRGGHNTGVGLLRDKERDILAALNGIVTYRFATQHVNSGFAIESIVPLLEARVEEVGYEGNGIFS